MYFRLFFHVCRGLCHRKTFGTENSLQRLWPFDFQKEIVNDVKERSRFFWSWKKNLSRLYFFYFRKFIISAAMKF